MSALLTCNSPHCYEKTDNLVRWMPPFHTFHDVHRRANLLWELGIGNWELGIGSDTDPKFVVGVWEGV